MSDRARLSASELLDRKAEQLARRHDQRLKEMSEVALQAGTKRSPAWLFPRPALALASVLVAVSIYWSAGGPGPEQNAIAPPPQVAAIPDWVLDEEVPLEILEAPEFYRWLADQMTTEGEQRG